jgi:trimethylamine--corrinoid protein Co-methyltransferase
LARARLRFLSREEQDLIHQKSLEILSEIGVLVRSATVLQRLGQAGTNVDLHSGIVRIPEAIVASAVRQAPKRLLLAARDPKHDLRVPVDSFPFISTDGLSVYTTDLETGAKRGTARADLAMYARLADALEPVSFFWPQVTASEVPQAAHTVHELWVSLVNCTKHIQGDSVSAADARAQVDLASQVVGGREELRKRPIISVTLCPIAPLSFEKGAVEAQLEFARAGIPVSSMSMCLGGLSSPVTLAGMIATANAENLASLVITQSAAPGAPHIYASESTPMDPVLGKINYSAPEVPLVCAGLAQMAERYGLPAMIGQWGVNGKEPGMPVSFSEVYSVVATTLAGGDMCSGMGGLEDAKGASLEQMVIDAHLWENCRALLREFAVTEETIGMDALRDVGHGNMFLSHPHTRRNLRKELFFRDKKKLVWESTFSVGMVPEARAEVRRLLRDHAVPALDRDILRTGDEFLRAFERQVAAS